MILRPMMASDVEAVVALQALAFPPPFDPEYHWEASHLLAHLDRFADGQFVVEAAGEVIASSSNMRISEPTWDRHGSWIDTVGGPNLENHDSLGSTLYGLDISVHPDYRRQGVGRLIYHARFDYVRNRRLRRYGTACRIPDWSGQSLPQEVYVREVERGALQDRTLSALLKYGMNLISVIHDYMPDPESGNAAALLEWAP